ncbi:hypothetical protein B0A50_01741 [Salinomyces thailandicus]|uniref:Alpha/beta hydrolase fold-3 domain-containing protein n=1 Tax=Salinomyces thailandicus TaxID=706561 RepID=A0A4U0U8N1_9PEZI|nr:hypothetical protein B0A50_01741 [Salinomyces thailandica]
MDILLPPHELDKLSNVDPEIGEALEFFPQSQLNGLPPEERIMRMRQGFNAMPLPDPVPAVQQSELSYTTRDGTNLRMLLFKPAAAKEPLPLLVWYHGGGFCLGRPEMNTELYQEMVQHQQCVVVAPEYRLAPEHKFPTPVEDSWDALQHIASHAKDYGADPKLGFILSGESAGSVISGVLSLQARDTGLRPPLTGCFLCVGSYFDFENIPEIYKQHYRSRTDQKCLSSPMLSKESKAAFDACHAPDTRSPWLRAALNANGHKGLPRTYMQACGMDINRDDSFCYRHLLEENGIETKMDVYPGGPHSFWFMFSDTDLGHKWKKDTQRGLKWLFQR